MFALSRAILNLIPSLPRAPTLALKREGREQRNVICGGDLKCKNIVNIYTRLGVKIVVASCGMRGMV